MWEFDVCPGAVFAVAVGTLDHKSRSVLEDGLL